MPITNESSYLPFKASPIPPGSWLVLAPHPDDETFGMGGTLLLAQAAGITVDIIFVTDGGQGGEQTEDLPKIRAQEARRVADKLGIRNIYFWHEPDRELKPSQHLITRLSDFIKQWQPACVFFPTPSEPHPDHRTTAVLAWESLRLSDFPATPISYDISVQGHSNFLIDISDVIQAKRALMADYKSQLSENLYIERLIALNKARTWSLPQSVDYAESFYQWPKKDMPLNALVLSVATQVASLQALPESLPLISVITRTQNRPELLQTAIRSVAAQSYPNIELIVVNDGGKNCEALVQEAAQGNIQQLHYQHLPKNLGRSAAANKGLQKSQGQFIIFLDDDDWFEPHHIETLYARLTSDKGAIAAYAAVRCLNAAGEVIKVYADAFDSVQLCIENFIPIHAILFKRSVLAKGCAFDESLSLCEDWDFWLQVQQYGRFSFVPQIGANYLVHDLGSGLWGNYEASKKVYTKWLSIWPTDTLSGIFESARYKKYFLEKEQELAQKNQLLTETEQELNQQYTQQRHDQKKNADLASQITVLNNVIACLEQEKEALYNSRSWRLTQPLRQTKQTLALTTQQPMKRFAYLLWSSLPLNIHQRIRIKTSLVTQFPMLNNLLDLTPIPETQIEWQESVDTPQTDSQTDALYSTEYYIRLDAARNNTPLDYVPLAGDSIDKSRTRVKVIAFYLPQFHPIPENDKEWGRGFTEWTNVSKAIPQFVGHYQPRLPGELGYYDLRLKSVQQRQIELAKQYGIDGFCYHHYWFAGKRVLEKPFQQILDDPSLDLPFCLCWANENWTRRWDGSDEEIILEQHHSPEDDIAFIKDITPALKDKRYIRINNKPLLIVYRPGLLPDPAATAARWRAYAQAEGIGDLHIVSAATFGFKDFASINYDGLVQFPPHNIPASNITGQATLLNVEYEGHVFDFKEFSINAIKELSGAKHTFPCVMMNWDNEARKPGKGHTFYGGTPENYKKWLDAGFDFVQENNAEAEQIVFINAWNEWAEGTYLEPDRRYGYAYLHATANSIRAHYQMPDLNEVQAHNAGFKKSSHTAVIIHLYYPDIADELLRYIESTEGVDYFINMPDHIDPEIMQTFCESKQNTYITLMPNKGRDILPFLSVLDKVSALGYDYLLKIHSKKTTYRKDGEQLRVALFNDLLGKFSLDDIIKHFEKRPKIGFIAPANSIVSLSNPVYLKNNQQHVQALLNKAGYGNLPLDFDFIAGSMFWARVQALQPLLALNLQPADFEEELGQIDGTLAHAIERLSSVLAAQAGYTTVTLDTL